VDSGELGSATLAVAHHAEPALPPGASTPATRRRSTAKGSARSSTRRRIACTR
jgi:hypothetical protein